MVEPTTPPSLLSGWLLRQLSPPAADWLTGQRDLLATNGNDRAFHTALGLIPRRLGRADLALDTGDFMAAQDARPGWNPQGWSVDEAARVLLVCEYACVREGFPERFSELCRLADVAESGAFYRGLPLYPQPDRLENQAAEGVRSNMRPVFEAVAHRNPYPQEQFAEERWNQMVVKALFIGTTLHPIVGLTARANATLARILCDYAHERWSAGRPVSPELWRCVGPFADEAALADLQRVVETGSLAERRAACLALAECGTAAAGKILAVAPDIVSEIEHGGLTWDSLARET